MFPIIGTISSSINPTPSDLTISAASSISTTGMTFNGSVTNMGHSTTVQFEYGTSPTLSSYTTVTAIQSPVTDSQTTSVSRSVTGLTTNTIYYYRLVTTTAGIQLRSAISSQQTYGIPSWTDSIISRPVKGVLYSDSVSASGLPTPTYSIQSGSLPTGLSINSLTGEITGTPTDANEYSFTIAASNSFGTTTSSYTVLIGTGITGGVESNFLQFRVHVFTGAGTLTSSRTTSQNGFYHAIGGGGGGGSSVGGGGGAGRSLIAMLPIAGGSSIAISIGAGGSAQTSYFGGQGGSGTYSSYGSVKAGGGGGGGFYNANTPTTGSSGESGAGIDQGSGGGGSGGVGISSLGGSGFTSGGRGQNFVNSKYVAGGGGGDSGGGGDGDASTGASGIGGAGTNASIPGGYIAAGGGGGGDLIPANGTSGQVAGTSGNTTGNSAAVNTGSGGGGCRNASGGVASGAGGSGLVYYFYQR